MDFASLTRGRMFALAVLMSGGSALAAPIMIDPFESGPLSAADTTADGSSVVTTQTNLADVFDGQRVSRLQLRQPGTVTANLATTAGDDSIAFSFQQSSATPAGGAATVVGLEYGRFDVNNQANLNLTAGGNDRFRITFTDAPAAGTWMVEVGAIMGGAANKSVSIAGPGTYEIRFSDMTGPTSNFNFTNVDSISMLVAFGGNTMSGRYEMADFAVVPEPAAGAAAAAFGTALLARRRRRR